MNSKNILLALIITAFALFLLVSSVSAVDNGTVNDNNVFYGDNAVEDLEFEQTYEPEIIHKDDIFESHLAVKNVGSKTYHNLTINYPLPEGLEVLICPVEYQNSSVWVIDTLYPNETNSLTLVCSALVANTTYEFSASVGNESVTTMDVYCQPEETIVPDDYNNTHSSSSGLIKSVTEGKSLEETANPIFLLLFTIIFIPYIRLKY